jgi:tetratricopeptide (TPR) repeat protein
VGGRNRLFGRPWRWHLDATISLEIASTYSNMKRFSEAEEWFLKARSLDASDPSAAIGLAEVNKSRQLGSPGNLEEANTAPSDAIMHLALGDLYRKPKTI